MPLDWSTSYPKLCFSFRGSDGTQHSLFIADLEDLCHCHSKLHYLYLWRFLKLDEVMFSSKSDLRDHYSPDFWYVGFIPNSKVADDWFFLPFSAKRPIWPQQSKKISKSCEKPCFFFFPPVFNPETEDVFLFPFLPLYSSLYRIKENFQTKDNLAQRHQCSQACTSWNTRALRSNMLSSGLVFHPERWDMRKNTNCWCCSKQHLSF